MEWDVACYPYSRMGIESITQTVNVADFEEFQKVLRASCREDIWLFRGHRESEWPLEPTLERALQGHPFQRFMRAERYAIWRFQQGAHRFLENPPAIRKTIDWLALMQHYGAPTRLLDGTVSPYVAAFFAHEARTEEEDGRCAVRALQPMTKPDQRIRGGRIEEFLALRFSLLAGERREGAKTKIGCRLMRRQPREHHVSTGDGFIQSTRLQERREDSAVP